MAGHHSNLISCYIPPCTLGDTPVHWTSHHFLNSLCISLPHTHISIWGYNTFLCLSGPPKFFLSFTGPFKQQFISYPCPCLHFIIALILPLIRIHCVNVCSSLLCHFIFEDMDHILLIFVFPTVTIT